MHHALGNSIVKLIPNLCMLPPFLRTTFSMRPPKEIICKGTNPFPSSWLWHAQAPKYEHVWKPKHVWKASGPIMSAIYKGCILCSNKPPNEPNQFQTAKGKYQIRSNRCKNPGIHQGYKMNMFNYVQSLGKYPLGSTEPSPLSSCQPVQHAVICTAHVRNEWDN